MALTDKLTAIADAIRAKGGTTELLTLEGMVDAISAIETGGGGIKIGQETPSPNWSNLFWALENGTAKTGTFLLASPLSSGEHLIFSSGLSSINGIMFINTNLTKHFGATTQYAWFSIALFRDDVEIYCISLSSANAAYRTEYSGEEPKSTVLISNGSYRIDGGDLYVTPRYAGNWNYTPFGANANYRWVAW